MMNRRIRKKKGLLKDSQYEYAKERWLCGLKAEVDKVGEEASGADWAKMCEDSKAILDPPG